ncbi:hypothetical protein [Maridesulfovibrio sp.]|uniref:hypothetical protein n=1 Tax=Maridesulfovibrio sp. TaxID=2795000 RepID=UPI002A18B818|nr:hypothetical protein [Maridesulfovibrio sp.]
MHKISLTDFVDVVSKAGTSKATKVATIKNRKPYTPATDFYKGIRDKIVEIVELGEGKEDVQTAVENAYSSRKDHYQEVADGFVKWMGRKNIEWFQPAKGGYGQGDISVSVNPEVGAVINGVPHLVKLYFKADKLPKNHAMISTHLMETCLRDNCPENTIMAVLDVKRGKLMEYVAPSPKFDAALKGELAYIESIWDEL